MKYIGTSKFNSAYFGALLGLVSPLIVLMGYYIITFHGMRFSAFLRYLYIGGIFLTLISLCAATNLLVFYIFIWTNRDKSARGVVGATLIYAIFVCIMKLI